MTTKVHNEHVHEGPLPAGWFLAGSIPANYESGVTSDVFRRGELYNSYSNFLMFNLICFRFS